MNPAYAYPSPASDPGAAPQTRTVSDTDARLYSRGLSGPLRPIRNVELRIECYDLPDLDTFSKSDPRVFVYLQVGQQWREIGKTEIVWNNLHPRFATPVVLPYKFETVQRLRFLVVDIDQAQFQDDPTKHDYIGYVETTMASLVAGGKRKPLELPLTGDQPPGQAGFQPVAAGRRGSVRRAPVNASQNSMLAPSTGSGFVRNGSVRSNASSPTPGPGLSRSGTVNSMNSTTSSTMSGQITASLRNLTLRSNAANSTPPPPKYPRIRILVEELRETGTNEFVTFRASAQGLDKKDFFGLSDPFLMIEKQRDDGTWVQVYRTPEVRKSLNPSWEPFRLSTAQLNNGAPTRPLRWSVWDWNSSGNHAIIGAVEASMTRVRAGVRFELINDKMKQKKGSKYTNSGTLVFIEVKSEIEWSFFDFVSRGAEVSLAVAIDFTQSNGDPRLPNSLHYRNPNQPSAMNEYQRAISAVGTVLEPYDSDKLFPVYGFGARLRLNGSAPTVSHLFPLNLNYESPIVQGVRGMLDAYEIGIQNAELWGPTNFSPVIMETTRWANEGWQRGSTSLDRYTILLIVTDGVITDMAETVDAIVEASLAPLSIIIVGVGAADFGSMEELDADERPLIDSKGRRMERDCVQFVPYRTTNPAATAEEQPSSTSPSPANGKANGASGTWSPTSWRKKPVAQDVHYDDKEKLNEVLDKIGRLPGLVGVGEIERLRQQLAECAEGKRFLLQGGDCAERFDDCEESHIQNQLKVLLQMSLVIIWGARMPLVRIARMAGQYAKPRSSPIESIPPHHQYNPTSAPLTIPSFRGDNINSPIPTLTARVPDPFRLLQAYFHSSATLNHIRTVLGEGFADLHRADGWDLGLEYVVEEGLRADYRRVLTALTDALDFMGTIGADDPMRQSSLSTVDIFVSHEGLSLEYEERLTRPAKSRFGGPNYDPRKRSPAPGEVSTPQPATFYNLGAHMIWLGDRTRQIDGAHVEYFRGIRNPIGIKVGPSMTPQELIRLLDIVDHEKEIGRVVLITRFGAGKVEGKLEPLVEAVREGGWKVVWCCDPMHGNTHTTESGIKTRPYPAIVAEVVSSFEVHRRIGSRLAGVHFECTGDRVTECLGGSMELQVGQLEERYETACDPRLNYEQSLDVAFVIAKTRSLDYTDPFILQTCRLAYAVSVTVQIGTLAYLHYRMSQKKDKTLLTLFTPANSWLDEPQKITNTTVWEYDSDKFRELMQSMLLQIVMTLFIHIQWGYAQALALQSIYPFRTLWTNQLVQIYLRGRDASSGDLKRPWKSIWSMMTPEQSVSKNELKRLEKKKAKTKTT
ncbi:hypothetical protein HDU93_007207 [Gonapodya sp. JEL0774]|nr:hypothetical protein HDU93_007207 [Gonapodya sp. JEL0774]